MLFPFYQGRGGNFDTNVHVTSCEYGEFSDRESFIKKFGRTEILRVNCWISVISLKKN